MSQRRVADLATAPEAFISSVVERLSTRRPVRRSVPGGWLNIDRMLPFLFAYRHAAGRVVEGVDRLVQSQASYLTVSGEPAIQRPVQELVSAVAEAGAKRFGSFLVVELWPAADDRAFRVLAPPTDPATTVRALSDALVHVDVLGRRADVETATEPAPGPPLLPPLLSSDDQRRHGALLLGLEVPLFFLDPGGESFPLVLRRLQRELAGALQRAAFEFAIVQTRYQPEDVRALGQQRLIGPTRRADRRLAEMAGAVDYLLAVTPMNADAAWAAFRDGGYRHEPSFHYRPLSVDPELLKRSLYGISLEDVEDPTLAALFRDKRRELDRQFNLLEDRDSTNFLHTSLQLYGGVDAGLVALAEELLDRVRSGQSAATTRRDSDLDAASIAGLAREELDLYRAAEPGLSTGVTIRDDVPGVMVSGGDLLVGSDVRVSSDRAEAIIEHEIGTHVVTATNGRAQPLHLLRVGLPGYEETQEALALLAEFMAGGLTPKRLETLAARVLAVRHLVGGATFVEAFRALHCRHELPARRCFDITMRVYRSGGLTKDAIYLRGLDRLLRYLAEGNPLEPLLVGKLALEHISIIQELQWREVLSPPRLRPRWLDRPTTAERLDAVRGGLGVLQLASQEAR